MKKFFHDRVVPLLLAFSLTVGVVSASVVPAKAIDPGTIWLIVSSISSGYSAAKNVGDMLQNARKWIHALAGVEEPGPYDSFKPSQWFGNPENRYILTEEELYDLHLKLKQDGAWNDDQFTTHIDTVEGDGGEWFSVIRIRPVYSLKDENGVPYAERNKLYLAYEDRILCAPYDNRELDDDEAHEKGIWLDYSARLMHDISSMHFLNLAKEYQRLQGFDCSIERTDEGYILTYTTGTPPYIGKKVYCNPKGYMYVCPGEDTVLVGGRDHVDADGNKNDVDIDVDNNTLTLPDGSSYPLGDLLFNPSNNTYYIGTLDQSTNITYDFSWTYNITHTSITYIGQTEEYSKYYEVYYELPDGRSSADLTAEELEQLNVNIDVVPYGRSTDDVSLRSLYHFDGDTSDDSFWNYSTSFTWELGSSITYMDAGVFNGALYLDEQDHRFTMQLPSSLGSKDFTIQWRYYQSHTPAAASSPDGFLRVGNDYLFSWDGKKFYSGLGTAALTNTNTGQWMELAVIRNGGTLYYYVNGLCVGSKAASSIYSDTITFGFGSLQQTYKYFDELRVLNFAYAENGAAYTPTSVPHDTNLALVLPDSVVPVADEYWKLVTDGNVLQRYDFRQMGVDYIQPGYDASMSNTMSTRNYNGYWLNSWGNFTNTASVSVSAQDGYTTFTGLNNKFSGTSSTIVGNNISHFLYATYKNNTLYDGFPNHNVSYNENYVASILLADGSLYSVPFKILKSTQTGFYNSIENPTSQFVTLPGGAVFTVGSYGRWSTGSSGVDTVTMSLLIPQGVSVDVVYMEVKKGTEPNQGHEYVESVTLLDKEDLHKSMLAVRTDMEITGYQIGGMRPSIPTKGLVWALVEGGVIRSLQIYNGSAWEAVDGRIWTGSRWVPYSAYNVLLMKDLYDIDGVVTPDDYEYIYTEQGFWSWLQKWLNDFKAALFGKLDQIIDGSGSANPDEDLAADCEHAYAIDFQSDPTCTDSGKTVYSCPMCGDTYTEYVDALDHDWVEQAHIADSYHLPTGVTCPTCSGTKFLPTLSGEVYSCSCSDCQTVWEEEARVVTGYTLYECSRCGEQRKEHNDSDSNLFEAIGNFLSDGVHWISDKLQQLVNSLSGITDIFRNMAETIKQYAGDYSGLFGEFLALMPADLMNVVWFGLVLTVALLVWKKWFS